jgi:TonB family protein
VDPARRFKLANIRARLEASPVPETRSAAAPKPASVPVDGSEGEKHSRLPRTIAVLAMLIAAILIVAVEIRWHSEETPGAAVTEDSSSAPATSAAHAAGADGRATGGSVVKGAVAERVLPEVPQRAMETIDGHVRVEIRVQVDRDGNVSDAGIVSQGPSRYFANYALNAARGWKFKPAQRGGHAANSTWMLHFVFQRSGVEVTPVETRP